MSLYRPWQRSPEKGVVEQGRSHAGNGSPSLQVLKGGTSSAPKTELGRPIGHNPSHLVLPPRPVHASFFQQITEPRGGEPHFTCCGFAWTISVNCSWVCLSHHMEGELSRTAKPPRVRPPPKHTSRHCSCCAQRWLPPPALETMRPTPHQLSGQGEHPHPGQVNRFLWHPKTKGSAPRRSCGFRLKPPFRAATPTTQRASLLGEEKGQIHQERWRK